ncbi:unnamed protein product [Lymnaea stagnalis]|uniref:Uncharacterized protein n=1 Tax=Lymnaea stagnalis TaxID=6523 RepID=A0AAV2H286_LYMST
MLSTTGCAASTVKLHPYRVQYSVPAGNPTRKDADRFRSNVIIPVGPLLCYETAPHWNYPGTLSFSSCPDPIVGLPFDTSKPRRGRWGETLRTKLADDTSLVDTYWKEWDSGAYLHHRDDIATLNAKRDLQKRIEICLYGDPREPPIPDFCANQIAHKP